VVLNVSSTTGVVATFQATAVDAYTVVTPLSTGFELLLDASAGALLAVGGVLVFLGLFLRGNVYGPPPPVVSRSADDVEEIARGGPPPGAP
jgi:hypothetical protein